MKPIHSPSNVVTTYHSGGTDAVAIADICADDLPAIAPEITAKTVAPIWPTRNPDDGEEEPVPGLALRLRRHPRRVEERHLALAPASRVGRHDRVPGLERRRCG